MKAEKYQKEYVVKSYECDCHGFLRILSLMNILQDIATENADVLGLGFEVCKKNNLAWVGSNYLIDINRLPTMHEHFTVITWPAETKLWGAIRYFVILDENGKEIIKSSSQWVLINMENRRPVMLKKYFPDYEAFNESIEISDFGSFPSVVPNKSVNFFQVRFDDIDINKHVNNSIYPLWASESVDHVFRMNHYPIEIEIWFKKEVLLGETAEVHTKQNEKDSIHVIYDSATKEELAACRIKWNQITSE